MTSLPASTGLPSSVTVTVISSQTGAILMSPSHESVTVTVPVGLPSTNAS